ncbi:MAG: SpoIIE family protein phosphatase [Thermacetogeniaceae bacterium]
MSQGLRVEIEIDADLFILEHKLERYLRERHPDLPARPLVVLVAKELATNILKHRGEGFVAVSRAGDKLILTAEDDGCKGDGAGDGEKGLGLGLDVARRSCEEFFLEQKPGGGFVATAVFDLAERAERCGLVLHVGMASRPHYLESECGDICLHRRIGESHFLFVADVLGHGRRAGAVAGEIEGYLSGLREARIEEIYSGLERAVQHTRGCAAFLAVVSREGLEYINVGNISCWLLSAGSVRRLRNVSGVIGRLPVGGKRFREAPLPPWFMLIACTDGVRSQFVPVPEMRWLRTLDVQEVAERIVEEFAVKEDDASALVARGGWMA